MEKINVVYPLGDYSPWQDNELRYSLRSLEEFIDVGNLIVVGHKPDWLTDEAIHIPAEDFHPRKKGSNICHKTLIGAKYLKAHDKNNPQFLMISDDHVILNEPDFSPYHRGELPYKASMNDSVFNRCCVETRKHLEYYGHPTLNYEGHYPVLVDVNLFIEAFRGVQLHNKLGYVIYSMYFNKVGSFPHEPAFHVLRLRDMNWEGDVWKYKFLNYNDYSLSGELKTFLKKRFPNKSRFEI